MAANYVKPVTFGATIIETPTKPQPALRSPQSHETNMSASSAVQQEREISIDSTNPFSAFYKHPNARRSVDEKRQSTQENNSKTHLDVGVYEHDLEAGMPLSAATTQQPQPSVDGQVKECTMWPTRQAMLEKKKKHQRARGCRLLRNLNSRQRLWVKILIGLLLVAAATGLGVGISRAVGGGVWASPGQTKAIPSD